MDVSRSVGYFERVHVPRHYVPANSRRVCSSSIGTFVVVNKEGWVVTAGHILRQWVKLCEAVEATQKLFAPNASTTFSSDSQSSMPAAPTPTVKSDPFFSVPGMVIGNLGTSFDLDGVTRVSITF